MDKLRMQTLDGVQDNIDKIAALFPNCITERKDVEGKVTLAIDFDKLRQELSSEIVEGREERYQFTWPDKKKAILLANSPINATLRPCREESVDFDNTQNLYIEGDNLDVLKCLKETYLGKVKMIYIDPPYNTGNDFVYEDDFAESTSEYLANSGQYDEQGNRLVLNTESNGRFHTDWLNMFYPRIKVAKDLLSQDGVLFISIDDIESDNVKKICCEIFGQRNFVADVCVINNLKGRNDKKYIARANERMLMFVKSDSFEEYGLALNESVQNEYKECDNLGKYRLLELRKRGGADTRAERPNMYYPFYVNPENGGVSLEKDLVHTVETLPIKSNGVDGRWRWGIDTAKKNLDFIYGRLVQGSDRYNIYEKDYLEGESGVRRIRPKSVMAGASYSTDVATKEYRSIMNPIDFNNPKPIALLSDLIEYSSEPQSEAIILDFFSGSATTAHAVMQLNKVDGGNRKFIMVQLPELTDEKSEAYKAGYKNICEIGKERIRRVGKEIKEESSVTTQDLDIGFRVLKLDSSNMEDVYYSPSEYNQNSLFAKTENVKSDRTSEDLLFQVMLELGATLDSKIKLSTIEGKTIFNVAEGYLVACFDNEINDDVVTAIAKMQPQYAVFRDSSMVDDSTVTNFAQIFKTYSPNTVTKVL